MAPCWALTELSGGVCPIRQGPIAPLRKPYGLSDHLNRFFLPIGVLPPQMDEITIRLEDGSEVELQRINIGVAEGVIAFDVEGVIRGLDEDILESVAGKSLKPAEITFEVANG